MLTFVFLQEGKEGRIPSAKGRDDDVMFPKKKHNFLLTNRGKKSGA